MCSSGINGGGELRGQLANPGSPGKWPLKWSVFFEHRVKMHFVDGDSDGANINFFLSNL